MNPMQPLCLDPAVFDPAQVADQTRQANAVLEQLIASIPSILEVPPQVIRDIRASGKSVFGPIVRSPNATDRAIEGPGGPLPLRVFATPGAKGVLLHIHGGGWALGSHDQQDVLLDAMARAAGIAIVSVGYRLAPEHPYPAGSDDCESAALWLVANAAREFGTTRLLIGGESAGAHLSVTTMLRLRDRHGLCPFAAAYLTYGGYDMSLTPSGRNWGARNLVLSTPIIQQFINWYAAPDPLSPDVSPLHADLHGLPPALFTIGTLDPLLDDSLFMANRWVAAGNAAELAVYPGGVHAFNILPIPLAEAANARIFGFLKRHLDQ